MLAFRHISTRLIFWILGGTALALFALGYYQQYQTRRIVLEQVTGKSAAIATSITEELQGLLRSVEASLTLTAARLEEATPSPVMVDQILTQLINTNSRIYGSTVAYASSETPDGNPHFAPYLHRHDGGLAKTDLAAPDYAYWQQDWFTRPMQAKRALWTEPYFDAGGGNINMVTYSMPFHRKTDPAGIPTGVVTADIGLTWLKKVAESNRPGKNGYIIVISGTGRVISHPKEQYVLAALHQIPIAQEHQQEMTFLMREIAAGRNGHLAFYSPSFQSEMHVAFRPVKVGGWGVIVGYQEADFLEPVHAAGRVAIVSGIIALALLAIIIVLTSRWTTLPLTHLAASADAIARGNLDIVIARPRTRDEIGDLTNAFRRMRDNLRTYIADLASATAARQKLESELAIAQQIQRTMLPAPTHVVAGPPALHLHAEIVPAKTVGGDLYAYFTLPDGRLCFAVGDVSDKGVPAALFMARTITLLKTIGREAQAPDEILRRVNAELYPDNDECMFVTLFCGIIDPATGRITAASAGHEPPIVVSADGQCCLNEIPSGSALGLERNVDLPVTTYTLAPGETLLLYTDGVTDAVDTAQAMFTRERLLAAASELATAPEGLAGALRHRVEAFSAGADQADDITLFTLRRAAS